LSLFSEPKIDDNELKEVPPMLRRILPVMAYAALLVLVWFFVQASRTGRYLEATGWLLFLVKIAYERFERFYMLIQHVRYWLFNEETHWDISAEYITDLSSCPELLTSIEQAFIADYPRVKVKRITPDSLDLRVGPINLELRLHVDSNGTSKLRVDLLDMLLSYRGTMRMLDQELMPMLQLIEKQARSGGYRYWLAVKFLSSNPYYGLYLKRLSADRIIRMNAEIKDRQGVIQVTQERIRISADCLTSLRRLSLSYLTLSAAPH
jgi:hypothetical protein